MAARQPKKIDVILKRPGARACWAQVDNTRRNLVRVLQGEDKNSCRPDELCIKRIATNLALICLPRHPMIEKRTGIVPPYNCRLLGLDLHGSVMLIGTVNEHFDSVPAHVVPSLWFGEEKT